MEPQTDTTQSGAFGTMEAFQSKIAQHSLVPQENAGLLRYCSWKKLSKTVGLLRAILPATWPLIRVIRVLILATILLFSEYVN